MEGVDPLLQPGSFIDPTGPMPSEPPTSNGDSTAPRRRGRGRGRGRGGPSQAVGPDEVVLPNPDWLPSAWILKSRPRVSGRTAGSFDKYYVELATGYVLRSKKEVLDYLETGTRKKKTKDSEAADSTPRSDASTAKRKKCATKEKDPLKDFNFNDVPSKVKWELTDFYEGAWRALSDGVGSVAESTGQEWKAAFSCITSQNAGK